MDDTSHIIAAEAHSTPQFAYSAPKIYFQQDVDYRSIEHLAKMVFALFFGGACMLSSTLESSNANHWASRVLLGCFGLAGLSIGGHLLVGRLLGWTDLYRITEDGLVNVKVESVVIKRNPQPN